MVICINRPLGICRVVMTKKEHKKNFGNEKSILYFDNMRFIYLPKVFKSELGMAAHAHNPNTQVAEARF